MSISELRNTRERGGKTLYTLRDLETFAQQEISNLKKKRCSLLDLVLPSNEDCVLYCREAARIRSTLLETNEINTLNIRQDIIQCYIIGIGIAGFVNDALKHYKIPFEDSKMEYLIDCKTMMNGYIRNPLKCNFKLFEEGIGVLTSFGEDVSIYNSLYKEIRDLATLKESIVSSVKQGFELLLRQNNGLIDLSEQIDHFKKLKLIKSEKTELFTEQVKKEIMSLRDKVCDDFEARISLEKRGANPSIKKIATLIDCCTKCENYCSRFDIFSTEKYSRMRDNFRGLSKKVEEISLAMKKTNSITLERLVWIVTASRFFDDISKPSIMRYQEIASIKCDLEKKLEKEISLFEQEVEGYSTFAKVSVDEKSTSAGSYLDKVINSLFTLRDNLDKTSNFEDYVKMLQLLNECFTILQIENWVNRKQETTLIRQREIFDTCSRQLLSKIAECTPKRDIDIDTLFSLCLQCISFGKRFADSLLLKWKKYHSEYNQIVSFFRDNALKIKGLSKKMSVAERIILTHSISKLQYNILVQDIITIGRDYCEIKNTIPVPVDSVSKNHVEIDFNKKTLRDLGSMNGTSVNFCCIEKYEDYPLSEVNVVELAKTVSFSLSSVPDKYTLIEQKKLVEQTSEVLSSSRLASSFDETGVIFIKLYNGASIFFDKQTGKISNQPSTNGNHLEFWCTDNVLFATDIQAEVWGEPVLKEGRALSPFFVKGE